MKRKTVSTDKAPKAIGPYSQAVRAGGWVFCSGQIALDLKTGALIGGGVAEQTRRCLENLSAVLAASGTSLSQVVKTTVYLQDMAAFQEMNAVYAEFFPAEPPARAAVQAAALPKGAAVEIDAVAFIGS